MKRAITTSGRKTAHERVGRLTLASAVLATLSSAAAAQENSSGGLLEEVVVTAQKRSEDQQRVPLSVAVLNTAKLEELHIDDFNDYVKYLPNVTFQSYGPGYSNPIIRGVSSVSTNHSGPLPTVGTYLDEQPVTTIQGVLDLHLYDVARIEVLAGPQGTLYGASSEAGTIKIVTNKPDPSGFSGGYEVEGNTFTDGEAGGLVQGFVNLPLSDNAAIRLVGWGEHTGGYIDNVPEQRLFPSTGVTIDNSAIAEDDFNESTVYGARAALRVDLNDTWTVTPGVMAQTTEVRGSFVYEPRLGDLNVSTFNSERIKDSFVNASLTVEGKISNFDLVYAGAGLKRDGFSRTDYSDYSYAYDIVAPSYTTFIVDNDGNPIDPSQEIRTTDRYKMQSHELRLSSPADERLRAVAGLFYQRQEHQVENNQTIDNLATDLSITGWPGTFWLTKQLRVNRDYALFSEVSFDITDALTLTGGMRFFKYDNSLEGFYGFNNPLQFNSDPPLGEASCPEDRVPFRGAPCKRFDKSTSDTGNTPKVTLSYQVDDRRMLYATYSEGFRPGGINRAGTLPPYNADFLKNYEIGWKTSWGDNRVRFNGAIFQLDWEDFQFSFIGANALTRVANAANARIRGIEGELTWAVTSDFTLSGAFTVMDPELTDNYCGVIDAAGRPITNCPSDAVPNEPLAPAGTQLPTTSKFKGSLVARYEFSLADFDAHAQASYAYQTAQWPEMRVGDRDEVGRQPAFGLADVSLGLAKGPFSWELFVINLFDERGQVHRYSLCGACSTTAGNYTVPTLPRLVGLKFTQDF